MLSDKFLDLNEVSIHLFVAVSLRINAIPLLNKHLTLTPIKCKTISTIIQRKTLWSRVMPIIQNIWLFLKRPNNCLKEILIYDPLSLALVHFIPPTFSKLVALKLRTCEHEKNPKVKKTLKKNFEWKISLLDLNINPRNFDSTKLTSWVQKQVLKKLFFLKSIHLCL